MTLLPYGQQVYVTNGWHRGEVLWVTSAAPSYFIGGGWRYELRSDRVMKTPGTQGQRRHEGGEWYDEIWLVPINDEPISQWLQHLAPKPKEWPPKMTRTIGKRLGIYGSNGMNDKTDLMYSWEPGAITCIGDYLGSNGVFEYKRKHPEVPIIIRFYIGPTNFQADIEYHAKQVAARVISKWDEVKLLDPYIYFCNELNLHYENGDPDIGNQWKYTTPEFYQNYAKWVGMTADIIKNAIPEMKLVTPPFAFGHKEDGEPDDDGNPKLSYAGYDYLAGYEGENIISKYFDNILTFHGYWHQTNLDELYHPELSSWHAFRWRRVLKLFETRYNIKAKMIIDECGNFNAGADNFFDQLQYYGEECLSDERVLAVTPFLWDDPTNSPGNVPNSWVHNIGNLEQFCFKLKSLPDVLEASPDPEPTPEPEPEPDPDPTPEPEPSGIKIEYVDDTNSYVRGDLGKAGIPITLIYWGNKDKTTSGSKENLGPGGFEFMTHGPSADDYTIEIDGREHPIEVRKGETTYITMGDEPGEELVILQSKPMSSKKAEAIMAKYPDLFEITSSRDTNFVPGSSFQLYGR